MTIDEQVLQVLSSSQGYDSEKLDISDFMSKWYEHKKKFIEEWGSPIIQIPLPDEQAFELPPKEKDKQFEKCIAELHLQNVPQAAIDFLWDNAAGFYDNKTNDDRKLTKSLKEFMSGAELRQAQDIVSKYIQANKIRGNLYLSVHPLDFLTSSENNANWTSCHSLDGDYRAGNLSYAVDDCTVICYLADPAPVQLKQFPQGLLWNNKKWRRLLHFSHYPVRRSDIVYLGRPYPFPHDTLTHFVQNYIMGTKMVSTIHSTKLLGQHYLLFDDAVNMRYLASSDSHYVGYNDLIQSNVYSPIAWMYEDTFDDYCWQQSKQPYTCLEDLRITIGGAVPCAGGCGKPLTERDSILCDDCASRIPCENMYCEDCGHRIYTEDEIGYWDCGNPVCKKCIGG